MVFGHLCPPSRQNPHLWYEEGLAVPIKTYGAFALNIWFNSAKVLPQLEFAFLALFWELFMEPGVLGDTNCVVSPSKLL